MNRLLAAAADSRFIFVAGKGGVGKTTTAGALALASADAGDRTHLISTDPAHSLADLMGEPLGSEPLCSERLTVEELDAAARADAWLARALGPVTAIVERGTYLDAEDVAAFSRLALPGVDELMAVLRLADLAQEEARVVVDTAPTGHALRLLDAAAVHESFAAALRAMAAKADAVATAMIGAPATSLGSAVIAELEDYVRRYRQDVLGRSAFVVVARADGVVVAETARLLDAVRRRGLAPRAVVWTGVAGTLAADVPEWSVPVLADPRGCAGLRAWSAAVRPVPEDGVRSPFRGEQLEHAAAAAGNSFAQWLREHAPPLLLFAGKGGVGKSTCAAAAALALTTTRNVLLCSADPAGSVDDVLAGAVEPRLRTLQVQPTGELARLREDYYEDVNAALTQIGLSGSAVLDRRVIEALWDLTPPGLDELAATIAMLDMAQEDESVVLDAAPTGHFLRMLETPETALAWTRQLMRVVVKYGIAASAPRAAESLLQLSRGLRSLVARLRDPARAAVVVVTLDEPLVRAETERLLDSLAGAGVRVVATLHNRTEARSASDRTGLHVVAPDVQRATGANALREFAATWKIVT